MGDLARMRGRQEVMCLKNCSQLCQDSRDETISRQQPWRWSRSRSRIQQHTGQGEEGEE